MAEFLDTFCSVTPIPLSKCANIVNVDNNNVEGTFYIKAEFEFLWRVVLEEEEEDMDMEVRRAELFLPRNLLLDESWGQLMLRDILSGTNVPTRDHRLITEGILSCARSMARDYPDGRIGILPMSVLVTCGLKDGQELDVIPGSIRDKMRKVKVEGEARTCPICLDEIPSGSVAASLPCSHVYHDHCVFTWLLNSRTCPSCRSKI